MTLTYLPQDPATERKNKQIECMAWLLERMRRRAQGRERIKAAERRRRNRGKKRGAPEKRRISAGVVEDIESKNYLCYVEKGILYRCRGKNASLNAVGPLKIRQDISRQGGKTMKTIMTLLVITVVVLVLFCAVKAVWASDDYIWEQHYGDTTYYTDQDGRSAVAQTIGDTTTLYDNGSGLVDSGRVTL